MITLAFRQKGFLYMLRALRKNRTFNKIIRRVLKSGLASLQRYQHKWLIFGTEQVMISSQKVKWYSEGDDDNLDYFYYGFEHIENPELCLWEALAKKSSTIVDVGAHTGIYTLLSARSNASAHIFAFEPNPSNVKRLRTNLKNNNIDSVRLETTALGDQSGTTSFYVPEHGGLIDTSSVLKAFSTATYHGSIAWKEISVAQTSLDIYFQAHTTPIELLKIDVEGYEMKVFEGAKEIIQKHKPLIICEIFLNPENKMFFEAFLHQQEYCAYLILKEGLVRLDKTLVTNHDGLNYLFSKNRTQQVFTSFKLMDQLIMELM